MEQGFAGHSVQLQQVLLTQQYRTLQALALPLPPLDDCGFRIFSQGNEDGLIHYIFSLIGTTNKLCLDIAYQSPYCANTTNLLCNRGWNGLLLEGDPEAVARSRQFFASHPDTRIFPPTVACEWVTTENVNEILRRHGMTGEIDLFSLDVDGVDYWLWKSLDAVRPRVVVVEFMNVWGPDVSVTVPYRPDFNRHDTHPDYFGASLLAFVRLAREKGYRLVGCNHLGYNAFFVQNGVGEDVLPQVSHFDCLMMGYPRQARAQRQGQIRHLPWVRV